MITIDSLREYGANVEEGLARCMGKEEFYLMLVKRRRRMKNSYSLKNSWRKRILTVRSRLPMRSRA